MFNPLEKGDEELTLKQRLFCKAFVSNGYNATQAAITAGYSENTASEMGSENLTKPRIVKYIDELMQETVKKLDISREWVFKKLKLAAERGIPDEITGYMTGESVSQIYEPKIGLNALSELNKMCGYYAKTDNTNEGNVQKEVEEAINEYEREY